MGRIRILCVDFQKDWTRPGGKAYKLRPSVEVVKQEIVPFLLEYDMRIVAEVMSDYRQPRRGGRGDLCYPGTTGFESDLDSRVRVSRSNAWIKAMNSPIWTRDGIGDPNTEPGEPYENVSFFQGWLYSIVGQPKDVEILVLMGLTIDCCVLCMAQQLKWYGYSPLVLIEGVDADFGSLKEKMELLYGPIWRNFAKPIYWRELQKVLLHHK